MNFDIDEVRQYIEDAPPESEVFIGCDSHKRKNKKGQMEAVYVTVVVIHRILDGIGQGCKLFKKTDVQPDYGSLRQRLMNEVYYSGQIAMKIVDSVGNRPFAIHLDVNEDKHHASNVVMREAIGFVKSLGLEAVIKPDSVAANAAADRYAVRQTNKKARRKLGLPLR